MSDGHELHEQMLALGRIQILDTRIDKLEDEQRQIPVKVAQVRDRIDGARRRYEDGKASVEELSKQRRQKERELQDGEARLKQEKAKLMAVKTNEEYQAVQREIAHQEEVNDALSEEILLLLEKVEQAELELKKARLVLESDQRRFEGDITLLEQRLGELPGQVAELQEEKGRDVPAVDATLFKRYSALRTQKGGVAIAKANGGICGGCHMSVSPLVMNRLQTGREIIQCSNCRRILYWEGDARVNVTPKG